MPESSALSDIFGRSAWPMIKEMGGIEVFNVDADDNSCYVMAGGQEYKIKRIHYRRWHTATTEHWWTFGSQWELLAWIGDRL